MIREHHAILTGSVIGFMFFIQFLESKSMGNVLYRGGRWCPRNLLLFIINPFTKSYLWYPGLWRANWIISTSVGAGCALVISGFMKMTNVIF